MNRTKQFAALNNFEQELNAVKSKTLKWQTICYSGTHINQSATISAYTSLNPNSCGDIVLFPGLAANTNIDPLMKTLMFWGLTHRRNVFCIDTFLGDFKEKPSAEDAQKNTYPEFVSLIEQSIKFIQPFTIPNKNTLIGHSAGATGLTDALNNLTAHNINTNAGSVILFAPCFGTQQLGAINKTIKRRIISNQGEMPENMLPLASIFDVWQSKKMRHIYIPQNFVSDMFTSVFKADLIVQWNTHVTIVAAENDTKVSLNHLQQCYEQTILQSDSDVFKFVLLPKTPHSILLPNSNNYKIINVVKNQKTK